MMNGHYCPYCFHLIYHLLQLLYHHSHHLHHHPFQWHHHFLTYASAAFQSPWCLPVIAASAVPRAQSCSQGREAGKNELLQTIDVDAEPPKDKLTCSGSQFGQKQDHGSVCCSDMAGVHCEWFLGTVLSFFVLLQYFPQYLRPW